MSQTPLPGKPRIEVRIRVLGALVEAGVLTTEEYAKGVREALEAWIRDVQSQEAAYKAQVAALDAKLDAYHAAHMADMAIDSANANAAVDELAQEVEALRAKVEELEAACACQYARMEQLLDENARLRAMTSQRGDRL
jgi:polyhydroxyalkanoate synthesis regulator phasin